MDRQDNMPAQGRRSASRATKLRRRKQRMNALLLIGAIAAILWLVFVLPVWLGLPSPFTEPLTHGRKRLRLSACARKQGYRFSFPKAQTILWRRGM